MAADHRVVSIQDFLRTNLKGTVDFDASKVIFQEIVASCKASGIEHILLDVRNVTATDITVSDIFSLVMHLRSLGFTSDFRMVIVDDPNDPNKEINRAKLFEHCAQHQGMDVATFNDFEKALAWLNEGSV